jgi:streptomycin 6-kinase
VPPRRPDPEVPDAAAVPLPAALRAGAVRTPEGAAWVADLPGLVRRAAGRWSLELGPPFPSGSASWCAPARTAAGADLVLKISVPHAEARHEAAVLRAWAGRSSAPLVAEHAGDWALLLGRVRPGTPMTADRTPVARRLADAADVLRGLHAAPPPADVPDLAAVGGGWAALLQERADRAARAGVRADPAVLRSATALLTAPAAGTAVLLHGDLNPGNLLRGPDGWCAIDPKAMRGDPAYDPWPLLEQVGAPWRTPDPVRTLGARVRLVADRVGLPAAPVAAWSAARATEAALWDWHHGAPRPAVHRRLVRAGDWLRVRDRLAG